LIHSYRRDYVKEIVLLPIRETRGVTPDRLGDRDDGGQANLGAAGALQVAQQAADQTKQAAGGQFGRYLSAKQSCV
jgi:hypothetical protein